MEYIDKEDLNTMIPLAVKDEANAISFYRKILDKMPIEHEKHREEIRRIIKDEADHYFKWIEIAKDMNINIPERKYDE